MRINDEVFSGFHNFFGFVIISIFKRQFRTVATMVVRGFLGEVGRKGGLKFVPGASPGGNHPLETIYLYACKQFHGIEQAKIS